MTTQLLVTFIDYTNVLSSITLTINKDKLILNSKYFESLFSKNFDEHNKNVVQIDLTSNENCYDGKIIEHFFRINTLKHKLEKQKQTILNTFNDGCTNPAITEFTIKLNFCFDMDFSETTEMLQLCDYFICDKLKDYLINCVITFPIFLKNLLRCKQINYTFDESYVLEYLILDRIDNKKLNDEILLYKQKFVLEQFMKNIVTFFTFYKTIDELDIFKEIVKIVDKIIDNSPKFSYFRNIDEFEKLNITDEELKQIPLDTLFQLLNYAPKLISIDKTVFKLYDFYDILNYEPWNFETFEYMCNENCKDTFCANNCVGHYGDECEDEEICPEPIDNGSDEEEDENEEEEDYDYIPNEDNDDSQFIEDKSIKINGLIIVFQNKEYVNTHTYLKTTNKNPPSIRIGQNGIVKKIMYNNCIYRPKRAEPNKCKNTLPYTESFSVRKYNDEYHNEYADKCEEDKSDDGDMECIEDDKIIKICDSDSKEIMYKNIKYIKTNKKYKDKSSLVQYDVKGVNINAIYYNGFVYKLNLTTLLETKPKIDKIANKLPYYTKSIVSFDDFINSFHTKTNNIFVEFDWTNVVLAGGFLYGLIDNVSNSILPGSDIDLFVFGEPDVIENKTKQLLNYFSKFNPYYVVNSKVITVIIPKLNYDIQIISFDNHPTELSIISKFDYNYVKLYFNGNDIYCTLDNLLAFKYKIAMLTFNENQKEYMVTTRIYKTLLKGLKIKFDEHIRNPCIANKCIMMDNLHDNDQIKSNIIKSVSIRKLIPHLENHEVTQLIKSYYKTQNVFTNINQIKFNNKENIENSEYDFLKCKNKNVNIDNINTIEIIKKFNNIAYYSFCDVNGIKYNNISIQTSYCTFKTRIYEQPRHHASLVLNITDKETKSKLIKLHNCLYKILNEQFRRNDYNRMHICISKFKKIEKNDEDLKLVIHINNNMKNYDKIMEQIQIPNQNSVAQVLCTGTFWLSKSSNSCGIKFYADNININKSYNIL